MISKVTSAIQIWRKKGARSALQAVISDLESRRQMSFLRPVIVLLNEVDLLVDEHAIALPHENVWKVIKIPELSPIRALPTLSSRVAGTRHGSSTHLQVMERLYTFDDHVAVEEGDTVVDVGAYVGGFSVFAANKANEVIAIEPYAKINRSLWINAAKNDDITIVPKAAWHSSGTLELNKSEYPNENSILSPDKLSTQTSFNVDADTVPNILRNLGYDTIDYLKIEAEGAEPEILRGALNDEMYIRKIAVDTSPERADSSTYDEVTTILENNGYTHATKAEEQFWGEYIVFAKLKDQNKRNSP